jgi:hypothetical protein
MNAFLHMNATTAAWATEAPGTYASLTPAPRRSNALPCVAKQQGIGRFERGLDSSMGASVG